MVEVVGIRFKRAGRIYYFDPAGVSLEVGDYAVVETMRGMEAGRVVIAARQVEEIDLNEPLKPVLRKTVEGDLQQMDFYREREEAALNKCEARIAAHNLPMKLVSAEYNFDGSRLTFCFTAEGRVDFRELVKDLASTFRTRIELRQIGVRDEAKLLGGLGRCGRDLCCSNFLSDFNSVSIKMAKEQDLPLNPMKISGLCGRLLCCLGYENEFYSEQKRQLPPNGSWVTTAQGDGRVTGLNVLAGTVTVRLADDSYVQLPADEVQRKPTGEAGGEQTRRRR